MIELCKLSMGQLSPALGSSNGIAEAKEQLPNFRQCKAKLTRSLNDRETVEDCGIVTPLPIPSLRGRKESDLFVIPDRRRPKPNLPGDLRNR
jgi:hypothetical protein